MGLPWASLSLGPPAHTIAPHHTTLTRPAWPAPLPRQPSGHPAVSPQRRPAGSASPASGRRQADQAAMEARQPPTSAAAPGPRPSRLRSAQPAFANPQLEEVWQIMVAEGMAAIAASPAAAPPPPAGASSSGAAAGPQRLRLDPEQLPIWHTLVAEGLDLIREAGTTACGAACGGRQPGDEGAAHSDSCGAGGWRLGLDGHVGVCRAISLRSIPAALHAWLDLHCSALPASLLCTFRRHGKPWGPLPFMQLQQEPARSWPAPQESAH